MRLCGRWKRAAVGVAAAMALVTGCGKKAAASPDQRYKEAEQKQVKEFSESFLGAYDTSREKLASDKVASGEGTMTITVSDDAKQTLKALGRHRFLLAHEARHADESQGRQDRTRGECGPQPER